MATIYACSKCGSRDIQIPMWVAVNTREIIGDYDEGATYDVWCPTCETHDGGMEEVEG